MALHKTVAEMKSLLCEVTQDLEKATNGNKAASQRVRTGTIALEKVAKLYRKESIQSEKSASRKTVRKDTKRSAKPSKAAAKKGKR